MKDSSASKSYLDLRLWEESFSSTRKTTKPKKKGPSLQLPAKLWSRLRRRDVHIDKKERL